jgi:hypothetical protein
MHAYFYDRWWQQQAILAYFHTLLAKSDGSITVNSTVNQTPNGATFQSQLMSIPTQTPAQADASLAPFVCDASKAAPGRPDTSAAQTTPSPSPTSSAAPAAASTLPNTSASPTNAMQAALAAAATLALATARRKRRRA